ncbi:uncharacterized protein N7482_009858 [Penicillium canariense]|uniref:Nudix hydrolase domain-containing protein n=1 Tax=Penicillium canariense TaxID=189055 RepID=A0A9W9LGP6_9EURO|nr:uncharacterized protein N7482_009858 [Penicillium canariense]KAJ5153380.1 hypothetical protein N7482_009858 [Penicillium canariense]
MRRRPFHLLEIIRCHSTHDRRYRYSYRYVRGFTSASRLRGRPPTSPSLMAPLNPASQEAIDRLRGYTPPPTAYGDVPLSRRAAVLILLYADPKGDLRVVITIRAKTLSSCAYLPFPWEIHGVPSHGPGLARSWPGAASRTYEQPCFEDQGRVGAGAARHGMRGRADALSETPFQTARREACEEIGLPDIAQPLPPPFAVEHLCELPANLAKTELVVRPCVALLHAFDPATGANADPEIELIPRLDAREVAAVFSARFDDFLRLRSSEGSGVGEWYKGSWSRWHNHNWRMHQFFVRAHNHAIRPRSPDNPAQNAAVDALTQQEESGVVQNYRVFGMTARIIVDAARVAFAREPEFEHNSHFGDEAMIAKLRRLGRLSAVRRPGDELTRETMEKAAKLS